MLVFFRLTGIIAIGFTMICADDEQWNNGTDVAIVIPPSQFNDTSCRLYLEGLQIYVYYEAASPPPQYVSAAFNITGSNGTYLYANVTCPTGWWNGTNTNNTNTTFGTTRFAFQAIAANDPVGRVNDEVYFTVNKTIELILEIGPRRPGYWGLNYVKINSLTIWNNKTIGWIPTSTDPGIPDPMILDLAEKELTEKELRVMNLGSVMYYSYACGLTKAAFISLNNKTTGGVAVGIAFKNIQVSFSVDTGKIRAANAGKFDNLVEDCVPTFTPGSLMGILVGLIFASVLMFAFLMLSSVQTMDRFDDPKQKQILINVRE